MFQSKRKIIRLSSLNQFCCISLGMLEIEMLGQLKVIELPMSSQGLSSLMSSIKGSSCPINSWELKGVAPLEKYIYIYIYIYMH